MTTLFAILTAAVSGLLVLVAWGLDDWLGLLHFRLEYMAACLVAALALGALWLVRSRRSAVAVGVAVFALLLSPYVGGAPSSRILRGVLAQAPPGTPAAAIEGIVQSAYADSPFVMPAFERSHDRVWVSLITQQPGDCTAAYFHLDGDVVARAEFSAD